MNPNALNLSTSMTWLARCGVHHKIFKHLNFYKLGM